MSRAVYRVIKQADGFAVDHDGQRSDPYATREAAFEAILGPASNALKSGHHLVIEVPETAPDKAAN